MYTHYTAVKSEPTYVYGAVSQKNEKLNSEISLCTYLLVCPQNYQNV